MKKPPPILKLVKSEPERSEAAPVDGKPPRKPSPFAQFMLAYADAIDQEVKTILDL